MGIETEKRYDYNSKETARVSKWLQGDCDLEMAGLITALSANTHPEINTLSKFAASKISEATQTATNNVRQAFSHKPPTGPK